MSPYVVTLHLTRTHEVPRLGPAAMFVARPRGMAESHAAGVTRDLDDGQEGCRLVQVVDGGVQHVLGTVLEVTTVDDWTHRGGVTYCVCVCVCVCVRSCVRA